MVDVSNVDKPCARGVLDGLGSARQIQLHGTVAYVISREEGLYAIEIANPCRPTLISRYDTVEYATGLAVCNSLLIVSLRQYVSLIRTGEAQSLCMDGTHVYAGARGSKKLGIADRHLPVAQYDAHGRAVMDLLLREDGQYVMIQVASLGVAVLEITCPESPPPGRQRPVVCGPVLWTPFSFACHGSSFLSGCQPGRLAGIGVNAGV
ncbi:MAG: hypothetical protein RR482_04680 [Clostridia bacterium]